MGQNAMKITARLDGLGALMAQMEGLKKSVQNRILRPATQKAAAVILAEAKAKVAVESGLLKKSLGVKIKTFPSGVVVALIGPRKEFRKDRKTGKLKAVFKRTKVQSEKFVKRRPTQYAHLVEFGFVMRGGRRVPARSFLRASLDAKKAEAERIMAQVIQEGLQKAWRDGR